MLFFLSLLLVCVFSVPTFANAGNDSQEISVLRTIALNTPAKFGHSQEWDVVQETPLYDVNDTLIAYCFDLIAQDSSGITSYVIVSVGDTQFPILLFGYEGTSAYLDRSFERAYYFGTLDFFVKNDGMYESAPHGNGAIRQSNSKTVCTFES